MATVVFVATSLGAAHGGINVFNAEILRVLRAYDDLHTLCVVPSRDCVDPPLEAMTEVVALHDKGDSFGEVSDDVEAAASALKRVGQVDFVVGHDVVTGKLAIEIANRLGAKKVLVHHMAYGRYLPLMRDPKVAEAKERDQQHLFAQGDHCIAVGPLLLDSLHDIRRVKPEMPAPVLLLPPLLDVTSVATPRKAPRVLYSGRIEIDNSPVKQAHLAARAIGRALRYVDTPRDTSVDIYGFDPLSPLITDFRKLLEKEAGRKVPVKCLPFTESRGDMLDAVKNASLVVMPSVHEGFGLVAWEAMCCGIPLIVSTNSGFYRFIESLGLSRHAGSVTVAEHNSNAEVEKQVQHMADLVLSRISHPLDAHNGARELLDGVRSSGVVNRTLDAFAEMLGHRSYVDPALQKLPSHLVGHDNPLTIDLAVQIDIGRHEGGMVYRCLSSLKHVENVLLAISSGLCNSRVTMQSTYLDELLATTQISPDADERNAAAVQYEIDRPKIAKLVDFFEDCLRALASRDFVDMGFTNAWRAASFIRLVEIFSRDQKNEDKRYIAAVHRDPYMTFSLWVSTRALESTDFFEPGFSIEQGGTLADIWLECPEDVSAGYIFSCFKRSAAEDVPRIPPLGCLLDWSIGSH